uniref:PH domain-containing protein n=1 Tax=Kryptolebias marmoratus TaxID=37003 RepID=A0A3Q3A7I2_KRYMA
QRCVKTGWRGFMFKQWKEKFLVLTMEGSLLVCRDAESPPDQVVPLQSGCQAVAEGREILDLPRLPPGGRRDCCFALILPQNKFLLLLSDGPEDCRLAPGLWPLLSFVPLPIRPFTDLMFSWVCPVIGLDLCQR